MGWPSERKEIAAMTAEELKAKMLEVIDEQVRDAARGYSLSMYSLGRLSSEELMDVRGFVVSFDTEEDQIDA